MAPRGYRSPGEFDPERSSPQRGQHRFEIELDDVHAGNVVSPLHVAPRRLRHRRMPGRLWSVAAALTIAGSAVVVSGTVGDGSSPEVAATEPTIGEGSRRITTPPTLPPIEAEERRSSDAAPEVGISATGRSAPLWRVPSAALVEFDLDAALKDLADDVARRSHTQYVFGGHSIDAVIVHDPSSRRDEVVLTAPNARVRFVIDRDTGTVLLDRTSDALLSESAWDGVGGDRFVRPPDGLGLGDWIDRLMLGPVTPATTAAATVIASDWLTSLDAGVGVARRFEVRLAGTDAPEWVAFPFDGVGAAGADTIELEAFVGQGSDLILVTGQVGVGDAARTFTHQLEQLSNPVPIALPEDALAIPIGDGSTQG